MKCKVNGINIFYNKSGEGIPLLLLHGNGEDSRIFNKATAILSEYFTVYAIDTRGHGQSEKIREYHYDDFAEDIKAFIEKFKLDRPILYGFSDGGITGLILASKYPGIVRRLIISGVNTVPEGIKGLWLKGFTFINKIIKSPKIKMMLEEPNITATMLQNIKVKTTVTAGSKDIVRESHTKDVVSNIPGSKLIVLKNETHGSYIVKSNKIAEIILNETIEETNISPFKIDFDKNV